VDRRRSHRIHPPRRKRQALILYNIELSALAHFTHKADNFSSRFPNRTARVRPGTTP
jgi:hypothetical protein